MRVHLQDKPDAQNDNQQHPLELCKLLYRLSAAVLHLVLTSNKAAY